MYVTWGWSWLRYPKGGIWFNKERFRVPLYFLLLFCFDELRQNTVYLEEFVVKTKILNHKKSTKKQYKAVRLTKYIPDWPTNQLTKKLTNNLTPWKRVVENQIVKKCPHFMKMGSSLPPSPEHSTCPYTERDQSSPSPLPNPIAWRSILILSSYLGIAISSGLIPQVSPPNPRMDLPLPHTCCMPRPINSSWFDHPNNIWRGVQS
jgi:hypothetical protein